jgi:hypothetical protein
VILISIIIDLKLKFLSVKMIINFSIFSFLGSGTRALALNFENVHVKVEIDFGFSNDGNFTDSKLQQSVHGLDEWIVSGWVSKRA